MKHSRVVLLLLSLLLSSSAMAANLHLNVAATADAPIKFAAEEIRREAASKGMTLGDDAQAIRTGTLDSLRDSQHRPHIARRGIKFNIPLDLRTPSYTDCSDAAQANIPEMWEREFWTAFLDSMARHRYNVLSLWSLHPFPSLVKVPEFPEVALNDVWRTRTKLDDTFSFAGADMVRPAMLADHEVVKRLTIEEKIEFWRWVMQHAADRGIQVYFFTWNVFTFGAEGKHGITNDEPMDVEALNQIKAAAESAATLASQMLAFSRKQILTRRIVSINAVVTKIESMVSRVIGHDIAMLTELELELRKAKIDIGQIEQILMNLSVNARAAMPDGGILSIRTANVAGEVCGINGPAVMLEIGDTGCGMSQEVIEQVFEPFFTTKGNQGTGLGLSVVKGIVEQHEGHILVESAPGKGTWFHLFFPAETTASDEEAPNTTNIGHFQNRNWGRGQTILIVEDEAKVVSFLTTVLQGCGFSITTAKDGQDAMISFAQADGGFDLVICDFILSDINGVELVKEFIQERPNLPVILSTVQLDRFADIPPGNVALLEKPYSIITLFKAIERLFAVKAGAIVI